MTTMTRTHGGMGFILAAALLMLGLGSTAEATYRERCGRGEITRYETRPCPNPKFSRTRACCTRTVHNGTRTRCKSWPRCPKYSGMP